MARRAVVLLLVSAFAVVACHRRTHHEANVEVSRVSPIRKDESGKVLTVDVELTFSECPGTQIEVIRGGPDFAECVAKYNVGDHVKLAIDHYWAEEGYYRWAVKRVGDCTRELDNNDEASYALVRECDEWTVNGTKVGFQCKYVPEKKLIQKCPWFRRR